MFWNKKSTFLLITSDKNDKKTALEGVLVEFKES